MNVIIIQSPLVQLNTPYPSGAYLKSFFQQQNFLHFNKIEWFDFSNLLFSEIFSKTGLELIFSKAQKNAILLTKKYQKQNDDFMDFNLQRYISTKDAWINWIDSIKAILGVQTTNKPQNKKLFGAELRHEFIFSPFSPKGARMESFLASLERPVNIDDAQILGSLALADLADFINVCYDENFSLINYAEHIATSEKNFTNFEKSLNSSILKDFLEPLTEKTLSPFLKENEKTLFCISVPFAGCFTSALCLCKKIKNLFKENAIIALGGGYINTELREISEERLFNYCDFISYDRGYGSYIDLMQNNFQKDGKIYYKTTYLFENKKLIKNSQNTQLCELENDFTKSTFPDYSSIDFSLYPRLADNTNPMHRIWNCGSWLKAYMAHGCYWHKCTFCDTTLDYVCRYIKIDCKKLHAHLLEQARKTGIYGIHFVDEACPPQSLVEFAKENILSQPQKLTFWGNIRFEKTFTRDMADFLSYAGLIAVSGGIEIATANGLKKVNKGTTAQDVIAACCAFKEAGILIHAYMIYGFFSENDQDTINSMEILRQMFEAELLDSSFWHKFVLTKHSALFEQYKKGKEPNLKPIIQKQNDQNTKECWFSQNDIRFEGEQKSAKFSNGLNIALENWMHSRSLKKPLQIWFDFQIPKPTVEKDFVKNQIQLYEEKKLCAYNDFELFTKNPKDYTWLGGNPIAINNKIRWFYYGEQHEIVCNSNEETSAVIKMLNFLSANNLKNSDTQQTIQITKSIYKQLRGNGLIKLTL